MFKRYVRLYQVLITQFFKIVLQSKVDFFLGLIGFFLVEMQGVAFLLVIFQQIPNLRGWTLAEMVFIYGFAQIPRGLDHLFTDTIWFLSDGLVIDGDFDRYMVRPMNLFFQMIAERIQIDALGELLMGILLVGWSISNGRIEISVVGILLFIISMIAGSIIYTAIKLFCASLAFWMKSSFPILKFAYRAADFGKYPFEIYSKAIKILITWIIPFGFVAYLPSTYFLKKGSFMGVTGNPIAIGIECIIAVILWVIAYGTFKVGTSHYESAGN